ncbi:MAG TPA: hypothetical protein VHR86_08525 [Armatimonadota bacterium]|nr:hypothetical protein [Armatimonadota bacterium]
MDLSRMTATELTTYLMGRVPDFPELPEEEREALLRMAMRLAARNLSPRFILASVSDTVSILRQPLGTTENTVTPEVSPAQSEEDRKKKEARRLADQTQAVLREARSARHNNEVKRMRGVLRHIDQYRLRETLGAEGDNFCLEIHSLLERLAQPVRRGRPRTQRAVARA